MFVAIKSSLKKHGFLTSSILIAFIVVACGAMLFASIAEEVRENETLQFDTWALTTIHSHSHPLLDKMMPILTDIGGVVGGVIITATAITILALRKNYRRMIIVLAGVVGAVLLNLLLKSIFMRSRPDLWVQLIHEAGYSFPSGHSMMSASFAAAITVALWHTRYRWWCLGLGIFYTIFVGFSRMYLGVHYPSDVVGGWIIAITWVGLLMLIMKWFFPETTHKDVKKTSN